MNIEKLLNDDLLKEEKHVKSGKFSPSLFGACFRRQIWNRADVETSNPMDLRTLRVFKAGHLFHDYVQNLIDEKDCEVLAETGDCKGYADIVTKDTVVDIKSQHSQAFWYMVKEDYDFERQKIGNILQVMYYCLILHKPFGVLCYISKDDLTIKQYLLRLPDWEDRVNDEIITLCQFWNNQTLPMAQPRLYFDKQGKSKECGYCAWKDKCKAMTEGSLKVTSWK